MVSRRARGDADWDAIYEGYTATLDWPGAAFWRELADAYPEAKVLLTVRDPQDWYESYCETIRQPIVEGGFGTTWDEMVREVIVERDFGGEPDDRDHLVGAFAAPQRRRDRVHRAGTPPRLPSERRLGAVVRVPRYPGSRRAVSADERPRELGGSSHATTTTT